MATALGDDEFYDLPRQKGRVVARESRELTQMTLKECREWNGLASSEGLIAVTNSPPVGYDASRHSVLFVPYAGTNIRVDLRDSRAYL